MRKLYAALSLTLIAVLTLPGVTGRGLALTSASLSTRRTLTRTSGSSWSGAMQIILSAFPAVSRPM